MPGFIPPGIGGMRRPPMGVVPPQGVPPQIGGALPMGLPPQAMKRPSPPMNSTVPPPMRSGGIGGVAPRPAQGKMMRGMRGRGGVSMF